MSSPSQMIGDGRQVAAQLVIKVYTDGALSIEGPIDNTPWCLAALDNAKDAVKNHRARKNEIIIPGKDVTVP